MLPLSNFECINYEEIHLIVVSFQNRIQRFQIEQRKEQLRLKDLLFLQQLERLLK